MDTLTKEQRSERMSRVRGKDTAAERVVRRLVFSLGYRYRLHVRDLPGVPDLVFRSLRKVIFVHGCFWHRHRSPRCRLARVPKTRVEFWLTKLEGNRLRDTRNLRALRCLGWQALVVWECQLRDLLAVRHRVEMFMAAR
jgi:DNA mismatch endonuclease, patch repair protein